MCWIFELQDYRSIDPFIASISFVHSSIRSPFFYLSRETKAHMRILFNIFLLSLLGFHIRFKLSLVLLYISTHSFSLVIQHHFFFFYFNTMIYYLASSVRVVEIKPQLLKRLEPRYLLTDISMSCNYSKTILTREAKISQILICNYSSITFVPACFITLYFYWLLKVV